VKGARVDPIRKRGLTLAVGSSEHIQEEMRSAGTHRACGLFTDLLPARQPEQPSFRE